MEEESDSLDFLLSIANEELQKSNKDKRVLKERDLFQQESNLPTQLPSKPKNSFIHSGDTDSSEDEDSRNWEDQKYSANGRDIKKLLDSAAGSSHTISIVSTGVTTKRVSHLSSWNKPPLSSTQKNKILSKVNPVKSLVKPAEPTIKGDVYTDPIFGLRIINPLISSTVLQDRMQGREAVNFYKLDRFLLNKTKETDWVLAGVIANKSAPKVSQKGNQFSVWTLTDLKDDIKTISMFLFAGAHQQLWKTTVGTVVGVLNPDVLERKDGKDEACLSINNSQKVMVFGQSKDFGTCRSVKKNGDKCTAIVNTSRCEYCVYHIKQEYQKCSIRSDLQSTFGGRGLTALRNKVLGKNEVFYAGKSYTAIPAKKSRKLELKDNDRLNCLDGRGVMTKKSTGTKKKGQASMLEVNNGQRNKDLKLLEKLNPTLDLNTKTNFEGTHSTDVTLDEARNLASSVLQKLKNKSKQHDSSSASSSTSSNNFIKKTDCISEQLKSNDLVKSTANLNENVVPKNPILPGPFDKAPTLPKLTGFDTGVIDLNKTITPRRIQKAKMNAIKLIQQKGPLKKVDPNNLRGTGVKRPISAEDSVTDSDAKKAKTESNSLVSERFKKIMAATSSHLDLLEARDDEEKDKYFHKLEAKERMEEKMITTHKIACKAVKCLKCKYTSFSASDLCKSERHPLKVFDAVKRFFKCGNCQNRTVCLEFVPLKPCNNCNSSKWEKTGMMKEKLVNGRPNLSIRGGEQKHLNSIITDSSVDLLVPD